MTSTRGTSKSCASSVLCTFAATAILASLIAAVCLDHRRAEACGGSPPPPFCAKTVTIGKAVTGVILGSTTTPTTMVIPTVVVLGVIGFPAGTCPPPPYIATVTLTLTCTPPPGTSGSVTVAVTPGPNVIPVPVVIPPGPPRVCTVMGTVTVSFTDGTTISNVGDAVVCIVEPAPGNPSVPRLDLRHVDESTAIVRVHPGDQALNVYTITNNDPMETFVGTLNVQSESSSRQPTLAGPVAPGTGPYSISDPEEGDDFPIAFLDQLGAGGCIPLPPDPQGTVLPTIERQIILAPGESVQIPVVTRPWGMCADGSCSEETVVVSGSYSDGTPGLACVGAVVLADSSQPPGYLWRDSGGVVQFRASPTSPGLQLIGQPLPDPLSVWNIDLHLVALSLVGAEPVIVEPGSFASSYLCLQPGSDLCPDRPSDFGRNRVTTLEAGIIEPGQPIGIALLYNFQPAREGPPVEIEVLDFAVVPGAPHGHERQGPLGMGLARVLSQSGKFVVDSFFDVFYQVSVHGIDANGLLQPLEVDGLELVPTGSGFSAIFSATSNVPVIGMSIDGDFRGYARGGRLPDFRRGDANTDFRYDVTDPVLTLRSLILNAPLLLPCLKAADANDDGIVSLQDVVYSLRNIFLGGPNPLPPYPACGQDPTEDGLTCGRVNQCDETPAGGDPIEDPVIDPIAGR